MDRETLTGLIFQHAPDQWTASQIATAILPLFAAKDAEIERLQEALEKIKIATRYVPNAYASLAFKIANRALFHAALDRGEG